MELHPCLPQNLEPELLAAWIIKNSVGEPAKDEIKTYFTEPEVQEMEHESANSGREMARLNAILKSVGEIVKKGNHGDKPITIKIPQTVGTKALEEMRAQNYQNLEKGYEVEIVEIYKVPNVEGRTMEYFTITGEHFPDRSTPMSNREIRDHVGMFSIDRETGNTFTEDGEIIDGPKLVINQ